jgi:undecaprenol kinase
MKNRPFHRRVLYAINGLGTAWRRESSFRTQMALASLTIVALIILRPAITWWAIIVLTISFVLAAELMNSVVEGLIDHLHPDRHPEIRIIKDMAAATVLLASIGALMIGGLFILSEFWH